ncbi:hypothetical protein T459_30529 [Capsicum annuum]|uniref:Endonuclease/exonuclease/phosphatase domain-containing protein n=1 Tax=Capsicum annuum TaxID=4072 RepID=A0A2G2Y8Q0_CAPAN|nr:hypothetical protein T459_30529 [Capsicum annuum]
MMPIELEQREENCFSPLQDNTFQQVLQAALNMVERVYGLHRIDARKDMWRDLEDLEASLRNPWLIMGDFNAVLNHDDRLGSQMQEAEVRDFNALLTNTGLTVLKTVGRFYTWTNSQVHSRTCQPCMDKHVAAP